jgi:hypothetical protein
LQAFVEFESEAQSAEAKKTLQGFKIKNGFELEIKFAKK